MYRLLKEQLLEYLDKEINAHQLERKVSMDLINFRIKKLERRYNNLAALRIFEIVLLMFVLFLLWRQL